MSEEIITPLTFAHFSEVNAQRCKQLTAWMKKRLSANSPH